MIRLILAIALTAAAALAQLGGSAGVGSTVSGGTAPYTCTVTSASSVACTHSLNTSTPWVTCYDGSGNILGGSTATTGVSNVVANSANQATITFTGTTTGTCVISTGSMGPTGATGATGPAGGTTVSANGPGYLTIAGTDYLTPSMLAAVKPGTALVSAINSPTVTNNANGSQTITRTSSGIGVAEQTITTETTFIAGYSQIQFSPSGVDFTIRNTTTGNMYGFGMYPDTTGGVKLYVNLYNSSGTYVSSPGATTVAIPSVGMTWMKIVVGTNILFSISPDGVNWYQVYSIAKATHFSSGPNRVGIGTVGGMATVYYWSIS